ncbi:outer membrane protein assembly factor BamB family protein [Paenibacillus sp. FJAT-27812]|uniref:outer membrane protein assembly factor BamB family protein n=1 Tax=Paenibacillus sp. FJAT-27812 TaxID=1684143 RepID=UPI0006A7A381|nr:PQQ-binding-like beta-propeller repeat protein [Paenibacillus sp. FJAT-27812]
MRHRVTVAALLILILLVGCTSNDQEALSEIPQTASPTNIVESNVSKAVIESVDEIPPTSTESSSIVPEFIQGNGYASGGYDKQAIQPTISNWAGVSRFKLADIEAPIWNLKGKPDEFMNIVIGRDGVIYNAGKNITAINRDGSIKWVYEYVSSSGLVGQFFTPSISTDGTIYVSNGDRSLYAINADGTLMWKTPTLSKTARESSPSIGDNGTLYLTSSEGLFAINPKDGSVIWTFAGSVDSPAIAKDGTIYISGKRKTDKVGGFFAITSEGTEKWYIPIKGINSSPTIGPDGTVYVITNDPVGPSYLVSIKPNGQHKYIFRIPEPQNDTTNISISDENVLYFATRFGTVYAIRDNGTKLWEYAHKPGRDVTFTDPLIDSEGTLLIGINDSYNFSMMKAFDKSGKDKTIVSFTEPPYYKLLQTGIIGSDGSLYFTIVNGHESILHAVGSKQKTATAKTDEKAAPNNDISQFAGKWSTPGSDELAFDISFTDDNSGVITYYSMGEEYPNNFGYIQSGASSVILRVGNDDQDRATVKLVLEGDGLTYEEGNNKYTLERSASSQVADDLAETSLIDGFKGKWCDENSTFCIQLLFGVESNGIIDYFKDGQISTSVDFEINYLEESYLELDAGGVNVQLTIGDDGGSMEFFDALMNVTMTRTD